MTPKEFWGDVVCVVYLLSKFSTKIINNVTPEEAQSLHKHHLKIFGCVAYYKIS